MQENLINRDSVQINYGHPYILVGSPQFRTSQGVEYKYKIKTRNLKNSEEIQASINSDKLNYAELIFDLYSRDLICPEKLE